MSASSSARILCISNETVFAQVRNAVRIETGVIDWNPNGAPTGDIVAVFIPDSEPFQTSLLATLAFDQSPNLVYVILDPSLRQWNATPRIERLLQRRQVPVPLVKCTDRSNFEKRLRQILRSLKLDCEHRVRRLFKAEIGTLEIEAWKQQFSDLGCKSYARKILACLDVLTGPEIVERLRMRQTSEFRVVCVLTRHGSDLSLLRFWEGIYGLTKACVDLPGALSKAAIESSILLFIDAIHSGEQLLGSLRSLNERIQQKHIKIIVRPVFATKFGLQRVERERLAHGSPVVDSISCDVIDNITCDENGRAISELQLRLVELGVDISEVNNIVMFCRKLGAELKAIEDNAEWSDLSLGLGGFGLGLTTFILGRPGKGVLPVVRLGGRINAPNGSTIEWRPLVEHRNMSGAG